MAQFIGLATDATAKDVADTFLREVWRLHGLPSEIISVLRVADSRATNRTRLVGFFIVDGDCLRRLVRIYFG